MNIVLHTCEDGTGWNFEGDRTINNVPGYMANDAKSSLILEFDSDNDVASYSFDEIPIADSDTYVVLWAYSRNRERYGISFGADEYLLFSPRFDFHRFYIPASSISEVRIRNLSKSEDRLLLSTIMLIKDQFPLDLMNGMKRALSKYTAPRPLFSGSGIKAGDSMFKPEDTKFLTRYSCIGISDDDNKEAHQVITDDNSQYAFSPLFDGRVFKNDFDDFKCDLLFPVRFGVWEKEIVIPSFSLWGFSFTQEHRNAELLPATYQRNIEDKIIGGLTQGAVNAYKMLVDVEAHSYELIEHMTFSVKRMLADNFIWVNNQKCYIQLMNDPVEITPSDDLPSLPKVQYDINVSFRENVIPFTWYTDDDTINNIDIDIIGG